MKFENFIQSLFHPLQPAADDNENGLLHYKEFPVSPLLRPYVYCYWELQTHSRPVAPYSYRVVADGCIDLIIDSNNFNGMQLAGIANAAFDIAMYGDVRYFGIRFLPGCVNQFFRFDVGEIAGQMIDADLILAKNADILPFHVFEKNRIEDKIRVAESFLLKKLEVQQTNLHPGLTRALYKILSTAGGAAVQTEAAQWISSRQLRRLFQQHIGCSPKLFSRIVRFQMTLRAMQENSLTSTRSTGLFYNYNYFDQAHFIKDFKNFSGRTPVTLKDKM